MITFAYFKKYIHISKNKHYYTLRIMFVTVNDHYYLFRFMYVVYLSQRI